MIIRSFSTAAYSTWHYYKALKVLFDSGEGCAMDLSGGTNLKNIFITHGHPDHFSGLGLILWHRLIDRAAAPLNVYYPAGDGALSIYTRYLTEQYKLDGGIVKFIELTAGQSVSLDSGGKNRVEAFSVVHESDVKSLGYNLFEKKKKLKSEYLKIPPAEIKNVIKEKGDAAYDIVETKLLSVCGDCSVAPSAEIADTELLIIDSTFLNASDRGDKSHLTVDEAIAAGIKAKAKKIVLSHFSAMYSEDDIKKKIEEYSGQAAIDAVLPQKAMEI